MSDLIDLAERLEFHADCSDMGRKPDPSSVTRRAANALRKAATLETKLAVAREALEKVVAYETPSANATTRRMAEHARQALKEIKI